MTADNQVTLEPCPFCGSSLTAFWQANPSDSLESMEAPVCECGAQGPMHPTREAAIAAWNTRTQPAINSGGEAIDSILSEGVKNALAAPDGLRAAVLAQTIGAARAALAAMDRAPGVTVWYGSMPESNGRQNWTATLHQKGKDAHMNGICFARSEFPDRVRYDADRMRWVIGELAERPDILAYNADLHSGYKASVDVQLEPHLETIDGVETGNTVAPNTPEPRPVEAGEVTQADREAWIAYEDSTAIALNPAFVAEIRAGKHDGDRRLKVFARHRQQSLSAARAEIEGLREALRFYADDHAMPNDGPWGVGSSDFGKRARAALQGSKG